MPEKRGAAGIDPGDGFASPSACLDCSERERGRRNQKKRMLHQMN